MTVYAVAQFHIHDREAYGRYMDNFMDVFNKFNGRLLVADDDPKVLEGDWGTMNRLVVMEFPSKDDFFAWAASSDYQAIAKDRLAGAKGTVLLASGFEE